MSERSTSHKSRVECLLNRCHPTALALFRYAVVRLFARLQPTKSVVVNQYQDHPTH